MGLLDYVDPDALRGKLKGLLGSMPVVQMAQGQAQMPTRAGLLSALREMPVFSPNAGESAYEAAMNIGPLGLGKIVYHGSPHKFDKFDASKIGTGEGAQAYGHGVYLADSKGVANDYATKLGGPGEFSEAALKAHGAEWDALNKARADADVAVYNLRNSPGRSAAIRKLNKITDEIGALKEKMIALTPSNATLYKADLPDEWIPKMLDWDKPVADLTVAEKKALQAAGARFADYWPNTQKVGDVLPKNERAAQSLQKAGIPGIRYLDGGSRPNSGRITMLEQTIANLKNKGASQAAIANTQRELDAELARASYNYVVFPGLEDQVKILERNGVPLGLLGGK